VKALLFVSTITSIIGSDKSAEHNPQRSVFGPDRQIGRQLAGKGVKKVKKIALLMLLVAITVSANAEFRVEVQLEVTDEADQATTRSFINRELRSLGDVEIVQDLRSLDSDSTKQDWILIVTVFRDQNGYGYSFSSTCLWRPGKMAALLQNSGISEAIEKNLFIHNRWFVDWATAGELRRGCELIVVNFDTILEDFR
jgi:hypothetical protein